MGYKPDVVQKAKFEYSLLGQVFNKGLDASEKQEGLLRRLKNIEGKNKQQLDLIRDQGDRQLDLLGRINTEKISPVEFLDKENKDARKLGEKINDVIKKIKAGMFYYPRSDGYIDDFVNYKDLKESGREIKFGEISLDEAEKTARKTVK